MIDIKILRENPELILDNLKKKFQEDKLPLVKRILKFDGDWRKEKYVVDKLRSERNKISEQINQLMKSKKKEEAKVLIIEAKKIPDKIEKHEAKMKMLRIKLDETLSKIPNFISDETPIGKDDSENVVEKVIGGAKVPDFEVKNHVELTESLGISDFESSAKVAGKGFYYLEGDLALLNQALITFAIKKMTEKGFRYVETPLMVNRKVINNVTDLNDQQNMVYKIEGEELFLIGTSEHSLIGRFIEEEISEKKLPIKHTSYSMCFRREVGSHGLDERGLFRTHQFNKVEMIVICKPEESDSYFKELQNITLEIFKELEIPTRVLRICSGDLGDLKKDQVDIEAWSPRRKAYFEVGSCSNLTDAQARKLKITTRIKGERITPHTLNNTAIATSRALVAILENNQNKDGSITIPKVLQDYMGGKKKIEVQKG